MKTAQPKPAEDNALQPTTLASWTPSTTRLAMEPRPHAKPGTLTKLNSNLTPPCHKTSTTVTQIADQARPANTTNCTCARLNVEVPRLRNYKPQLSQLSSNMKTAQPKNAKHNALQATTLASWTHTTTRCALLKNQTAKPGSLTKLNSNLTAPCQMTSSLVTKIADQARPANTSISTCAKPLVEVPSDRLL
jgi:hypothetical protein